MSTSSITVPTPPSHPDNSRNGILLALLIIPIGVVLWDVLWGFGFIASVVSFVISAGAVRLFRLGAGAEPARKSALWLLGIIATTVILSFLSGVLLDAAKYYAAEYNVGTVQAFGMPDFWNFAAANLTNSALWGGYITDIAISIAFAALGAYSIGKRLLTTNVPAEQPAAI